MIFIRFKILITLICVSASFIVIPQNKDAQGRKQGYWKKTDEKTGKLVFEGNFKDDKPIGVFKYYNINDSIKAIIDFKPDGKSSSAKYFHFNGKLAASGNYSDKETKDGVWDYFDEAGVLISRETYKSGKKHGPSYVFIPDGSISEERNFKNGLEEGAYFAYYGKNIYKTKGTYLNGEKEGRFIYYYPNGIEVANGFFKKGLKNGPWIYHTEDGKLKEKELYKNGQLASKKETEEFFSKNKTTEQSTAKKPTPQTQPNTTKSGGKK